MLHVLYPPFLVYARFIVCVTSECTQGILPGFASVQELFQWEEKHFPSLDRVDLH